MSGPAGSGFILYSDSLFFNFSSLFHCQCINNEARKAGIKQTLDLPDRTLQFIKDKPLMDQAIQPIEQKPLLVRKGATFTRIVVDQVQASDGKKHRVMFIGTGVCRAVSELHTVISVSVALCCL